MLARLFLVLTLAICLLPAATSAVRAQDSTGTTEIVSVSSDGTQGDDWPGFSPPSISADGRYVAFVSHADNLVPGDVVPSDASMWSQIFVHDRQTGQTERVSVSTEGRVGSNESRDVVISADGRYVAFWSEANNLVPKDKNTTGDVFVHDRETHETTRVSVASGGAEAYNWHYDPSISADGRYVAFNSYSWNLISGDTNEEGDVYVHDREIGQTTRVSVSSNGTQGNDSSYEASISADGRYVAFASAASNLVAGDTNRATDVLVHDRHTRYTWRVSVASDGHQGNDWSCYPTISADGRYVAFYSEADNLVSDDTNGVGDIFVHDTLTRTTRRVSVSSDGREGNDKAHFVGISISGDGRFVAFSSNASNLVAADNNGVADTFVHDQKTGRTVRVSVGVGGQQANEWAATPSMSADGRYIAFLAYASNLVPDDTNDVGDVFIHDLGPLSSGPFAPEPDKSWMGPWLEHFFKLGVVQPPFTVSQMLTAILSSITELPS